VGKLKEQVSNFKTLLSFSGLYGMSREKISEMKRKILVLEADMNYLSNLHKRFNSIFSSRGWITYDSISTDLMKQAITIFDSSGIDKAEELLLEYYKPVNLRRMLVRLKVCPELINRYKFIEYAFNDYNEGRYYSVVPLLFMVIDGTVNDVVGTGFHSDRTNLDVWDAITCANEGINKISEIFRKGRRKTTKEIIDLPYRNGILHGIDLGFDNYKVAAKCWHFLFIIRDWILSKKSEVTRKARFMEENRIPTFEELAEKLSSIEETKSAQKEWQSREITKEYLDYLNIKKPADKTQPECVAIEFLSLWISKNYGFMAKLYSKHFHPDLNKKIIEVREEFEPYPIDSFKILNIVDKSPRISEIGIEVKTGSDILNYTFRLLYEDNKNMAKPRNLLGGNWKILFIYRKYK
jgi:hypothetical protein